MNIRQRFFFAFTVSAITSLSVCTIQAAPDNKTATTPKETNSTIPQSSFVVPANAKEGRDPFFPESDRPYANTVSTPKTSPVKVSNTASLVLNGLSGSAEKRLAMINGRTFAEGEQAEVNTSSGKVQIRCIEIKADSVVVETGNDRRELHLKAD